LNQPAFRAAIRGVKAHCVQDLEVYRRGFQLQQALFEASKRWPKAETYALTDQVRRASRSIGANLSEAWAKRRYPAHFLSKLTDADGELAETRHWIQSAEACAYLTPSEAESLQRAARHVGQLLGAMIAKSETFCLPGR
jgi:four helix bundle protein